MVRSLRSTFVLAQWANPYSIATFVPAQWAGLAIKLHSIFALVDQSLSNLKKLLHAFVTCWEHLSTSTSYRCQQQDRWISKASLPIPIIFVSVYMEKDTKSAIDNGIDLGFQEWGPNPQNAKAILWELDIPLHLS
nr:Metallocarboxypeptidase inhibitor [Ipomoea batatas]